MLVSLMGGRKTPKIMFQRHACKFVVCTRVQRRMPIPTSSQWGRQQRLQAAAVNFTSIMHRPVGFPANRSTSQMSLPGLRELLNVRTGVWPGKALCFGSETLKEMLRRTSFSCIWLFSRPVLTWGKIFKLLFKIMVNVCFFSILCDVGIIFASWLQNV